MDYCGVKHLSGAFRDQILDRDPDFDISILDNGTYVGS